jgi:hypothetical protein
MPTDPKDVHALRRKAEELRLNWRGRCSRRLQIKRGNDLLDGSGEAGQQTIACIICIGDSRDTIKPNARTPWLISVYLLSNRNPRISKT